MSWLKDYREALEGVPVVSGSAAAAPAPPTLDFSALMLWLNVRVGQAVKQAGTFEQQRTAVAHVLSKALDFLGDLRYDGFSDTAIFRPSLIISPDQPLQVKLEAQIAPPPIVEEEQPYRRKSSTGSTNRSSVTTKTSSPDGEDIKAPSFEDANELVPYSAVSSDIETPLVVQHEEPVEAQSAGALLASQFAVSQIWPERSLERPALHCNLYTHPIWGDPGLFCYGTDPRRVVSWHRQVSLRASLEKLVFDYRAPAAPSPVRGSAKRRRTVASERSEVKDLLNRLRVSSGWTAYAWFVLCRRPELEELGIRGNDIMSTCGAEWVDLQKGTADQLREWLLSILEYTVERPVPADPQQARHYKARVRSQLPSPLRKQASAHAREKLRAADEAS